MEKVSLYVKKILALGLSGASFLFAVLQFGMNSNLEVLILGAASFLLFAYLDFRITDEKPRFLFGMNQSDTFLNQKGGFWNLFKWIVTLFGFIYDLLIWTVWGVFLLFRLFVDLLLLIKTIIYWIIHAIIWFIRQLFPPFIFLFKMVMHYLVNWVWWIYQLTVRNMKVSVKKNFYFIALWGTVPALFIVFLFYAIGQLVGIPELVAISAVFALVPLVWSYGEIAALRFEERCRDPYFKVQAAFRNGFDAVKSVLFYLVIIIVLLILEIVLNLLGWIPNLSMSFIGITLNLNMAISFVLVFMAVIIAFAASILPTHILYHPEHENNFESSLSFLQVIGKKFLRYMFVHIPGVFFGSILLIIPVFAMFLTLSLTDVIKDGVLENKISHIEAKVQQMQPLDAHRAELRIDRLGSYMDLPLSAPQQFDRIVGSSAHIKNLKTGISDARKQLESRKTDFNEEMASLNAKINALKQETSGSAAEQVTLLSNQRIDLEASHMERESQEKESIAIKEADLKEQCSVRAQMPILYFFMGILFAVFGGIVLAVFIAYMGNVYFELYNMREDDKASYWCQTIAELKQKDPNQPLLGFTFLAILLATGIILATLGILS